MDINDSLAKAETHLLNAGIATARLDCLVLFEDVLNTNRTQILAHPERELTEVEQQKISTMITQRAQHIPLAYIRGKTEFYGREFIITDRVLEPRPESETMIDILKTLPRSSHETLIDIGTGSGALAITAKLELPNETEVIATDIDSSCLALTKTNANNLKTQVTCYQGDLLDALPDEMHKKPAVLLCNLPYVPDDFQINTAAMHEPRLAIFGGLDGLDIFRRLFKQIKHSFPGETFVLCESLPPQHAQLTEIAEAAAFKLMSEQDFIQLFKRI